MELNIRNIDIALSDDLRAHAQRRADKLDRFVDRVNDAQLEVRRRPQRTGVEITRAQVTIHAGRSLIRAEDEDAEPKKAIDRAFDKLIHQLRRYHDRRTERKATPPHRHTHFEGLRPLEPDEIEALGDTSDDELDGTGTDRPLGIVRTKRFALKPMRPEEAIDQMELLGHTFYLFLNADEGAMNVVYRRRDGTFGLLAPERA